MMNLTGVSKRKESFQLGNKMLEIKYDHRILPECQSPVLVHLFLYHLLAHLKSAVGDSKP